MSPPVTLLQSALVYAGFGWHIFPLHTAIPGQPPRCTCGDPNCNSIGKHPREKGWRQSATTQEAVLRRWWGQWPEANIGLACGPDSGLWVLDVDFRHGGYESLLALWDEYREAADWPITIKQTTGSGSWHYFFRWAEGVPNSVGAFRPGLDTRAAGGLVVLPPSLHESGHRYEWTKGARPKTTPLADAPDWLLDLVRAPAKKQALVAAGVHETVSEGSRNDRLFRDAAAMRRRGMDEEIIYAALQVANEKFCSPPLDLSELQDISRKACRYAPETSLNGSAPVNGRALLSEAHPEGDEPPVDTEKPRFPLLTFSQLLALPPPKVQVAGLFDEESFIEVFGQTNHGKSLFVLDLALAIAKGVPTWFGRPIERPGPVVWVNADGGRGMVRRAIAWKEANGADLRFPFLTLMGSLRLNRPDEVAAFLEQIQALDPRPAFIVFDTLSRCIPGADENLQGEMTRVTESCHRLKLGTGGTVCLVHHTDKAGSHDRGSSVVKNETDTQIRVTMDQPTRIGCVHSEKTRDGAPFPDFYFSLQPVRDSVVIVQSGPIGEAKERRDREQTAWLRKKLLFVLAATPGGATLEALNYECGFEPEDRRAYRILRDLISDKKVFSTDDPVAPENVGRVPKRYWLVGSAGPQED